MNPDKMRTEYGKLIHLLQDTSNKKIAKELGFNCIVPIKTVYTFLDNKNSLNLLDDEELEFAVKAVVNDNTTVKEEIAIQIKTKDSAVKKLIDKYKDIISEDDVMLVIRSISDNNAYIASNANTITKLIEILDKYFEPNNFESNTSLEIRFGRDGARLSHDHKTQYHYVKQSLMLWREIMKDMFRLWYLSEEDLLDSDNYYRLSNTGQGLNRVQSAPRVGKAMNKILKKVYEIVPGHWVGLSTSILETMMSQMLLSL